MRSEIVLSLVCSGTIQVWWTMHAKSVADHSRHVVRKLQNCRKEIAKQSYKHSNQKQYFTSMREWFNPLQCRANYTATSNNMKLVHWPLMGGLLHLVQRAAEEGDLAGQCTNHCIAVWWSIALQFYCAHKGLNILSTTFTAAYVNW